MEIIKVYFTRGNETLIGNEFEQDLFGLVHAYNYITQAKEFLIEKGYKNITISTNYENLKDFCKEVNKEFTIV